LLAIYVVCRKGLGHSENQTRYSLFSLYRFFLTSVYQPHVRGFS